MSFPVMPSIDYEAALNEEQRGAVQAGDGPVLIIAAAGTGKTRTLIYRVAYLVEQGVDPGRILLLTFTNRAAREMLDRARDLVGPSVSGLWGGTFHHFANRVLRRHAEVLGYRVDFTILDQDDSRSLVKNIIQELKLADKMFPKPDVLLSLFSYAHNTGNALKDQVRKRFENHPVDEADILKVLDQYTERKKTLNAMDFDDLLLQVLRLFKEYPAILATYQQRFRYIMVDEYQDTNHIQAQLVELVAVLHQNLLVVGDDFQSIYSWRGANYRNILDFPGQYPAVQVFKLETNYRSVPEILEVANTCIAGNPEQFQKHLRAVREAFQKPRWVELRDGHEQAHFIIDRIHYLRREGYALKDIAVLYRGHFHSMELQLELTRNEIPYQITSGVRFFEQAHIKDVCSLLRLINAPGDELAFIRLLGLLPRVGAKTALKIWKKMGRFFDPRDSASRMDLKEALPAPARVVWEKVDDIFNDFKEARLLEDPAEIVQLFVSNFYDTYAVDTFDNYERRMEDIQELVTYVTRFKSLAAFLEEMALITNLDAEQLGEGEADADVVKLSTVHQAKGLEWKVVFVVWLADGMFPSGRSLDDEGGESEERRLFYVATTRAEDLLYLCSPQLRRQRDGGVVYYSTSRFVRELPGEVMVREKPGY